MYNCMYLYMCNYTLKIILLAILLPKGNYTDMDGSGKGKSSLNFRKGNFFK